MNKLRLIFLFTIAYGLAPAGLFAGGDPMRILQPAHLSLMKLALPVADVQMPGWVLVLGAMVTIASGAVGIWVVVTNRAQEVKFPQPVEIVVQEQLERKFVLVENHKDLVKRADAHDAEFDALWNAMRHEDKSIRESLNDKFSAIERSLGRIEGHIGTGTKKS
jgi:hypothetical protein